MNVIIPDWKYRKHAEWLVHIVQGNMALEGQAITQQHIIEEMIERTINNLKAMKLTPELIEALSKYKEE